MFPSSDPIPITEPAPSGGPVRLDQPHDTCFRCGRPTPPGVSLCERDNPARIGSPSATQVHGTIVVGVIGGFILLALLFRFASAGMGPFVSSVGGVATRADGGLDVSVRVTNSGERASGASCRISATGAPAYGDPVFFTESIPPRATREFTHTLQAPTGGQPLQPGSIVVRCN